MKILILRKRIITNSSISGILIIILGLTFAYDIHKKQVTREEAQRIEAETASIRGKSVELQNKVTEAKKYQEIWKTIRPNKKFVGSLRIDDVTAKIDALAEKYGIEKPAIKMTIPEELTNGVFKRSTVNITVSTATLTYDAVNDVKAIAFISEFIQSVPGYAIIANFDMKKTKKYTDQDLLQISTGKGSGAITVKVDFFWYLYKQKADPTTKIEAPKPEEQPIESQ